METNRDVDDKDSAYAHIYVHVFINKDDIKKKKQMFSEIFIPKKILVSIYQTTSTRTCRVNF